MLTTKHLTVTIGQITGYMEAAHMTIYWMGLCRVDTIVEQQDKLTTMNKGKCTWRHKVINLLVTEINI